jgi:hypothetical protein
MRTARSAYVTIASGSKVCSFATVEKPTRWPHISNFHVSVMSVFMNAGVDPSAGSLVLCRCLLLLANYSHHCQNYHGVPPHLFFRGPHHLGDSQYLVVAPVIR